MKKFFSLLLALLMLAVMLPVTAMADETGYVSLELTYNDAYKALENGDTNVTAAIAKLGENKFATIGAAQEALLGLFGITVNGEYSEAKDDTAPFHSSVNRNGDLGRPITAVKFVVHGTISAGTNAFNKNGFSMEATVGANHQMLPLNNITVEGADSSATITGNCSINAKIAGGYQSLFVESGTLTVKNIHFTGATVGFGADDALCNGPFDANSGASRLTVQGCTFDGQVYLYTNAECVNMTFEATNNTFTNAANVGDYAILAQNTNANRGNNYLVLDGNKISGYARGINVQIVSCEKVDIVNNEIKDLKGKTENGNTYGSAIQITSGKSFNVTGNTIDTENVNALHFYRGLDANVTINNNKIKAPYLLWNEANLAQGKITSSDNVLDITYPGQAKTKTEVTVTETIINGTTVPGTITIIVPSTEETKPADDQKNPATGANDFVGVAAAAAVMALLGSAVVLRKK